MLTPSRCSLWTSTQDASELHLRGKIRDQHTALVGKLSLPCNKRNLCSQISTNKCSNISPEFHLPIKTCTLLEYRWRFSARNGCKSLHAAHQGIKSSETRGSSVWEMTGYGVDDEERFVIGERDTLFVTAFRPARSTAHPPPFKYGCFLSMKYNSHNVKLITINHLLPKSRMHGASPPGLPVKIFKE